MFLFSKTQSILGIDIGTAYIKAVQLKRSGGKPYLESYGIVNVLYPNEGAMKFDALQQTAEILKALYERARFTTKKVVLSVPSNVAFVSVLNLPPMSEKELQKSVEYQAKKYIPLPMNDVNFGWQVLQDKNKVLSPGVKEETSQIKVLLTAVPKNVINNYLKVIDLAGFEAVALEIESLSLIRSLVTPDDLQGILIVDIGAKSTVLSLVYSGYLWVSRHLSVGGDTITGSVARSMGVSFERAEQMKRSSPQSDNPSPVFTIAKSILDIIKSETQQLVRIAENQGKKISKIILTGGGTRISNLVRHFSNIGPAVEEGKPLANLNFNPAAAGKLNEVSSQLSVAIGLALRDV